MMKQLIPFVGGYSLKDFLKSFGFWVGVLLIWELSLHFTAYTGLVRFLPGIGFTVAYAALVTLLTGLPGWAGRICSWIVPPVIMLVYAVQLVYYEVFGSFLSLAFVSAGGDAVAQFYTILFGAIWRRLPQLLILFVLLAGFYVLRHFRILPKNGLHWQYLVGLLAAAGLISGCTVLALPAYGTGTNQPAALLRNPSATVDRWAEYFGFLTAEALDLSRQGKTTAPVLETDPVEEVPEEDYEDWNLLPGMDFDKLNQLTDDPALRSLNTYFGSITGTKKNDFTGKFQGYNLIVICAEAFCDYVIDENLTPTLYKMSHEGIVFRNFYNSFPNLTTNGEYSLCMGLMPDLSRMSFAVSVENYLPYALGNVCRENGMTAVAYHNNVGTFYNRINTHTNMGYDFKAVNFGLDMEAGSPSSDLEMMEKTIPDYLNSQPFHAYYMTYSGHADYDFATNDMSKKNQDLVADLPYSEPVRAYLACQLELEAAMTYLLNQLEQAGIADRTLVVLTGDHLPYGLSDEAYAELAGEEATQQPFWRFKNSFICWTGGMEEPVVVDDYCCTMDILPTVLNLMGFDFDSRLLTGRDVLAPDATHMALLKDGSFLTKDLVYDANSGEITWKSEENQELADSLLRYAANQFTVSASILGTNYYEFVYRSLDLTMEEPEHQSYESYADTGGTWYEQAVELLTTYGALSGGSTGAFNGNQPASRADFVAMVTRSLGLVGSSGEHAFSDVGQKDWYYDVLSAAVEAGLISKAENFRPMEHITEEEAATILRRAKEGDWADQAVDEAVRKQAQEGYTGPADTLSRGAAAYLVAKLIAPDKIQSPALLPETEAPAQPEQPSYIPQPDPAPSTEEPDWTEPEDPDMPENPDDPFIPEPDPLAPETES